METRAKLECWLKGIAAAAIGAGSNAIAVAFVDPERCNPFQAGFGPCGKVMLVGAVIAVAHYLSQSPLPGGAPWRAVASTKGHDLSEGKMMLEYVH